MEILFQWKLGRTIKTKLLFVDDDPFLLAGLRRLLFKFRESWDLDFCASGREALRLIADKDFQVIVSDIRMPEMDGAELMKEVADSHPGVVRIILSGQAETEKVPAIAKYVHRYFSKPCNSINLHRTISSILEQQREVGSKLIREQITGMSLIPIERQCHDLLKRELEADKFDVSKAVQIILSDVSLFTKTLQLVKSSLVGAIQAEVSFENACKLLGPELLGNILLDDRSDRWNSIDSTLNGAKIESDDQLDHAIGMRLRDHFLSSGLIDDDDMDIETNSWRWSSGSVSKYLRQLWGIESACAFEEYQQ